MLNRCRVWVGFAVSVGLLLALAPVAGADTTLGTVTQPSGSTATACPGSPAGQLLINVNGGVSGPLSVPTTPGPVAVSQWQVNATGVASGTQLTLAVLRINFGVPSVTIVGTDTETVNTAALPADKVATFNVSEPIPVLPQDAIALYSPPPVTGLTCYWTGGSISGPEVQGLPLSGPPATGEVLTPMGSGVNSSNAVLNLAATLSPLSFDAGLSLTAGPANAAVGQPAVLTATVTNDGPQAGPITFTDPVPSGLTVEVASVGSGSCTTSAGVNIVTCTTTSLPVGQSTDVVIVVKPTAAQTYTDSATVTLPTGGTDPNPANNTASTTLKVSPSVSGPTKCVVPKLGGASVKLAKSVLSLLGCKAGKTKKSHSTSVPKGVVVGTAPGAGSYPLHKVIVLKVSSGPPPKKHKKKK